MDYIITTEQLTKKYKNFTSVNHVSLHIRKGSIYGFLGPNGAGKSTTMKMLLGLTDPTKGSFTIDWETVSAGSDCHSQRDRLFHRSAVFLRESHRAGKS